MHSFFRGVVKATLTNNLAFSRYKKFKLIELRTNTSYKMPKPGYYGVRVGRKPGIYLTWSDCEAQVKGYPNAVFKKFQSRNLAAEFVGIQASTSSNPDDNLVCDMQISASDFDSFFSEEEDMLPSDSSSSASTSSHSSNLIHPISKRSKGVYYAVHRGKKPGVYRTWTECEAQITNTKNASYRKFDDEQQALEYVRTGGIVKATKRELRDISYTNRVVKKRKSNSSDPEYKIKDPNECVVVFTDGASAQNGKKRARAGIGVYWGPNHPLNTSKRIPGRQTNNRAEIQAAIHALHQVKQIGAKKVKLYTDSQFLIHSITDWIKKWKNNGWKLVTGEDVVNKDDFIELEEVKKGLEVEWIYVKAHARNHGNDEADRLAVAGAKLLMCPANFSKYAKINNQTDVEEEDNEISPFILTPASAGPEEVLPLVIPIQKPSKVYYAVHQGKTPGVYATWTECEEQIKDCIKPWFKKFNSKDEALEFVKTGKSCKQIKLPECTDQFVAVFTDGASSCNGQEAAKAGIGVYWGPGNELNTSMRLPGKQTNNRAEIFAAVHALRQAKRLGLKNVRLYTDSKFVINGITTWIEKWKVNGWKLANGKDVINKDDFMALDEARQGLNVDWCHIKGHANNPGNVEADKLAVEGCTKQLSETMIIA